MKENKLIAEFMGMQHTDIGWYDNDEVLQLQDNTFVLFHDCNFLSSVSQSRSEIVCQKKKD